MPKEQTSNLSLPVQERACRYDCTREQMSVDRVFIERATPCDGLAAANDHAQPQTYPQVG